MCTNYYMSLVLRQIFSGMYSAVLRQNYECPVSVVETTLMFLYVYTYVAHMRT